MDVGLLCRISLVLDILRAPHRTTPHHTTPHRIVPRQHYPWLLCRTIEVSLCVGVHFLSCTRFILRVCCLSLVSQPDALVEALMGPETERLLEKFDMSPTSKFDGNTTVYERYPEDIGAWVLATRHEDSMALCPRSCSHHCPPGHAIWSLPDVGPSISQLGHRNSTDGAPKGLDGRVPLGGWQARCLEL
jgi:hypothetical protein